MAGQAPSRGGNPTENGVQRTRAWSGFWVVFAGDLAIAAGAGVAVWKFSRNGSDTTSLVAILTSAFTAISTMTTAYFGIKTMSNTAQSFVAAHRDAQGRGGPDDTSSSTGPGGRTPPDPAAGPRRSEPGPGAAPQRPPAPAGPVTRPSAPVGPPRRQAGPSGAHSPRPADPAHPTNAEIVSRMQEPPGRPAR